MSGTINIRGRQGLSFRIVTENPAIARRVFKLIKDIYDVHSEVFIKKNNSLKKNNIYIIDISSKMKAKDILANVGILKELPDDTVTFNSHIPSEIIKRTCCKRSYLRGAFLGAGSVSNPEKTYHLEFVANSNEHACELMKLINSFDLNSKVIQRKSSYVVYIKEGEQIIDLLNIIGAHSALLDFENVRVYKEMRNNVNRLVNCETANLNKTVDASVRQIESIKLIGRTIGIKRLSQGLREIAEIRMKYPDLPLKELGEMLDPPIGKSGVNHRLRKIERIAEELKDDGED